MDKKITKYMAILFLTLIVISSSQIFFTVSMTPSTFTARFYNVAPVMLTYVLASIYLLIMDSENERQKKIYTLLLLASYFLTFHKIYMNFCDDSYLEMFAVIKELIIIFILTASYFLSLVLSKDEKGFNGYHITLISTHILIIFLAISIVVDDIIKIRPGICLYFLSLVPIVINEFLLRKPEEKITPPKMIDTPCDFSDSYLFANYMSGLETTSSLGDLAVIINKEHKREIIVATCEYGPHTLRLEYFRIKKIQFKRIVNPIDEEMRDDKRPVEEERLKILSIILAHLGAEAASDELRTSIDEYDDSLKTYVEQITITYEQKKTEHRIELYSKADTSLFVETLDKTLPFPIERI